MERPKIEDFMPKDAGITTVHKEYNKSLILYSYMNALDQYIDELESRPVQAGVIKKNAEIYICKIKMLGFPFATCDKQKADDWVSEDPSSNYYDTLTMF